MTVKKILAVFFLCSAATVGFCQSSIRYEISFPNAVHHEAEVSLEVSEIPAGPLTFRMSRSSPGRYATHEFGKNVYNVKAVDPNGAALSVKQVQGDVYEIEKHNGQAKITYTIFGNWIDGTYLGIDKTHAHMNMPATFLWIPGMENRSVSIKFNDLEKYRWKVATQLKPGSGDSFTAENLQYFMDSPTELSAFKTATWTDVNTDKKTQTLRVTSHTPDDQAVVDQFGNMVRRMVNESKAVFGELPTFDYGVYTFLQDVNTENAGDGMEHRNSTVIVERSDKIEGHAEDMLSTFSHEFFHSWNVERIRPKTLEPFNFEHANMSNELWFAEGFTQYYGELILKRAGFRDLDTYCNTLTGLANAVLNSPGAAIYSPAQMSRYAVFADAGVAVDQTNSANIFTSYYVYGATVALALDLRLRSEFNLSLDRYMQEVWKTHGKTEIPYTIPDLQNVLAKITNNAFADDFFSRYVYGIEKNNYAVLLAKAGLILRPAAPEIASLGHLRLTPENGKMRISANTLKGSPAYQAGMDDGDYLLKINNDDLKSPADLNRILSKYKPGDEVELAYAHRKDVSVVRVKLEASSQFEVIALEKTGEKLSPGMAKFRADWLETTVKK